MMDDDDDAELPFNDGFVRAPPLNGKDNIITHLYYLFYMIQIKRASGKTPVSRVTGAAEDARDGRAHRHSISNHQPPPIRR